MYVCVCVCEWVGGGEPTPCENMKMTRDCCEKGPFKCRFPFCCSDKKQFRHSWGWGGGGGWVPVLAEGKGRGFFLCFSHCHSFSFLPCPISFISSTILSLFSLSLGDDTK